VTSGAVAAGNPQPEQKKWSELLGADGPLGRTLPGYELRTGQLAMCDAVDRTLRNDRILLVEAGTGTGKTLAYLVPAILSGRKIIVSTATRALQDQIFFKDLPLIERALGLRVHSALMKGLSNYLCRRRYGEFRASADSTSPASARSLEMIERWVAETESGDVGELTALGENDPVLSHVTSSSETRVGAPCQYHAECFVTRMKREADAARLIIVNHHLFFADLALRGEHPGRVLPDYDAVIFDEAHQLEDTATMFFGIRVSQARVRRVLTELENTLGRLGRPGPLFGAGIAARAREACEIFFRTVLADAPKGEGRSTIERDFWTGARADAWHGFDQALDGVQALAKSLSGDLVGRGREATLPNRREAISVADGLELLGRRAEAIREDLSTIVDGASGRVTFVDSSGRGAALSSSPVDLSALFRARIFESIPAAVLTSATLSSGQERDSGSFTFVRSRLGLEGDRIQVDELVVKSPFDFATRALLYLPDDLPSPTDPAFDARAADRIAELVRVTGGGAFVLTTSIRSMRALHRGLKERILGVRLFVQGERPKSALLAAFRASGDAVLVATASFWQGVDVPGDALRLVVLEKIPFPVPTEPVVLARARALESEGKNPFLELHLPIAKIALKQGFGRLIRSRADRGIVALLDERVHRRGYGKGLVAALPPARRATDMDEVKEFWSSQRSSDDEVPLGSLRKELMDK
jgi:ATP-dependent DNA helicase DinG